jgi:hypothetical protein
MRDGKRLMCPICKKRACDISDFPEKEISIEVKCPNCHNLVVIPCDASAEKKTMHYRFAAYAAQLER